MQANYKVINEARDLLGKRIILRLDLNVPIKKGEVRDDMRIVSSLPTIKFLKNAGAKIIIISHIESEGVESLLGVAKYLNGYFSLTFVKTFGALTETSAVMNNGDIVFFENLRNDPGEKSNDSAFARKFASIADIYVNEAFSVSHRNHASIVLMPKLLPSYAGLRFDEEVRTLSESFNPPRPALFIIGGAKFETKIPIIERFLDIADYVFVGGALANDIFREKGYEIGHSVAYKNGLTELRNIIKHPKLLFPSDVTVASPSGERVAHSVSVSPEETIFDAGPDTIAELSDLLTEIKYVLWNGPLGDYEKGFARGTEELGRAVIDSGAKCIVGGGDTVAVLGAAGLLKKFSFVSTGGGAMLEFLAKGTLPGIEALKN